MEAKKYLVRLKDLFQKKEKESKLPAGATAKEAIARLESIRPHLNESGSAQAKSLLQYSPERALTQLEALEKKHGYTDLSVIFAFDTTSSMGGYRVVVRDNLDKIVQELLNDKKASISMMVCGVGEYEDSPLTLQMQAYTDNHEELRKQLSEIRDTSGGGKCQVSLELLFQALNAKYIEEGKNYLCVVISDEIAHGQDGQRENVRADYQKELAALKTRLKGFYFVGCSSNERITSLQKQLINPQNEGELFIEFKDMMLLPELLIGITKKTLSPARLESYLEMLASSGQNNEVAQKIRGYLSARQPQSK